jgi:hypothetical protein
VLGLFFAPRAYRLVRMAERGRSDGGAKASRLKTGRNFTVPSLLATAQFWAVFKHQRSPS